MILLVLAKNERIRDHSSINTQRIAIIFIQFLPSTTLFPRGEPLFHIPPINILKIIKDFPSITRKYSKTSSPAELSEPQITNFPEIFKEQPAAATNGSNQQQQPAAATSSSNQQQQPAAATSSSNQQQQPAAATSSSNQQQQSPAVTSSSNQH